jgi:hypothetical protein
MKGFRYQREVSVASCEKRALPRYASVGRANTDGDVSDGHRLG